jgi:plasmid stability protein
MADVLAMAYTSVMRNVTLTIPDVPEEVVHGLEALAAASGRTVADEVRELLAERLPSERQLRQAALDRTRERRARMKPTTPDMVERGILDGRP